MKKLLFFCIFITIVMNVNAQIDVNQVIPDFTSQENPLVCKTNQSLSPNLINLETIKGLDHSNDEFYIKLYIHRLHKEQEPHYGYTTEAVNRILKNLYDDFDPLGIHFVWDGIIDEIYDDSIAFPSPTGSNFNAIFNTNNHQDGIDIYLADELLSGGNFFVSNGIANSTEMLIAGYTFSSWEVTPLSWHKHVSHTMGHILFLYDTHKGTRIYDSTNCAESADGSNGNTCGDYIRNNGEDCYVCETSIFTFYTNNDASYFNVLENTNNVSVSITPIDPFSASVTVTNLNTNDDEGSSGSFLIGHHINDIDNVNQPIWVGLPQTIEDSQLIGTDYIADAGNPAGHVLENNKWLGGTDYYSWSFPAPYHPVHYYDTGTPDPSYWQYIDYAKHFFFASTHSSGTQTGKVTVQGTNPCGDGFNGGQSNEICVVNEDDLEGDIECDPLPTPIYYYPNPTSSLLEIDLSLQPYKIFDIVIYDENQTVKYSDQSTNVVKTVDTFNLNNGTYYLHIYDGSDLILSVILIINH